jgi:hypothetical protein
MITKRQYIPRSEQTIRDKSERMSQMRNNLTEEQNQLRVAKSWATRKEKIENMRLALEEKTRAENEAKLQSMRTTLYPMNYDN